MNAGWQQRARLTCCNARTPLHHGRPSRVQRYSSNMHRAMEEDSLMTRYDDDGVPISKLLYSHRTTDPVTLVPEKRWCR